MAEVGQKVPPPGGGAVGQSLATESAPPREVLAQRSDRELYRERGKYGIRLVDKHYPLRGYGNYYADAIWLGNDGYLEIYHVHDNWNGTGAETYLKVTLNNETAEEIRKEMMAVKTFSDFRTLYNKLINATFCNDGENGAYICEDDDE